MANYPKELTDLVEEYLTDGILTGKERQVLLKKAEALGVDTEEFDLYLDAQQQKVDQVADAAIRKSKGKSCPFCGSPVPQLADKCPECGQLITAEASEELQEIFDNLEEALVDFKSGKDVEKSKAVVERYVRKAKMYYENNPKVQKLLEEVKEESEKAEFAAKKNARNKAVTSSITYLIKEYKVVASIVFALIVGTIGWFIYSGAEASRKTELLQSVTDALNVGDYAKAIANEETYQKTYCDGDQDESLRSLLINGLIEAGELESALGLCNSVWNKSEIGVISDAYIKLGEYDKAESSFEKIMNRNGGDHFKLICKCVLAMKEKGEIEKAKSYITVKSKSYSSKESERAKFRKDLLDILNN